MAENAETSRNTSDSDRCISVYALGNKTRTILSSLLNPRKVIPTESGLPRDWQGLAELFTIPSYRKPQADGDPTGKILKIWCETKETKESSTIHQLIKNLELLDRFDVIEEIEESLMEDICVYEAKLANNTVSLDSTLNTDSEQYILTVDDGIRMSKGLKPQIYDAFVLFADDDINFATELIDMLEKTYKLKLCVKDRDLVGGVIVMDVIVRLISERCNRLVVIISQAFFKSNANQYYVKFARSLGIEQQQRKIIPCIYSKCEIPPDLSLLFMLDYTRFSEGKGLWNFYHKLYESIQLAKPKTSERNEVSRSVSMQVSSSKSRVALGDVPIKTALVHSQSGGGGATSSSITTNGETRVQFRSLTDIPSASLAVDEIDGASCSSTSVGATSINGTSIKGKSKSSKWYQKILPKNGKKSHQDVDRESDKKKWKWSRSKRKVEKIA